MIARPFSWLSAGLVAVALGLAACPQPPPFAKKGDPCSATTKCAPGLACKDSKCVEDTTLVSACNTGDKRCENDQVESCKDDNSGWKIDKTCAAGCNTTTADCNAQICDPNDTTNLSNRAQCQGDEVMICKPDGSGWEPKEKCDLGCDTTTATCIAGTCKPNQQRCNADGTIQQCKSDGSGWADPQTCNGVCTDNGQTGGQEDANCLQNSCSPNALRCDGLTLVQCAADGASEAPVTRCPNQCATVDGVAQCVDATCTPGATLCSEDGKSVQRCNALGNGWDTTTCDLAGDGTGRCLLARGAAGGGNVARCISPICTASQVKCQDSKLLTCSADGLQETQAACQFGCTADGTACAQPACAANQYRCDPDSPDSLQVCGNDREGFVFAQFCAGGCVSDANTGARCGSTVCSPFIARCTPDGQLQTCSADGRGWDTAQACPQGETCLDNACVPPPVVCNDGETRCNGGDVEKCVVSDGKPSAFVKVGACLGACQGDSCDSAGECGPVNLTVPLVAADASLPADGQSTVLVLSDTILGPSGLPVPDGTLVTVAASSTDSGPAPRLLSGDADATSPGLQVPVVDGRIDFLIGAPKLGTGTTASAIKAQIGSHSACSGTLSITFDATVKDRYVSEDYSTTRVRDATAPVTGWDTQKGVLTLNAFDAGDGRDGDLHVQAGQTVDLSTHMQPGHTFADMASAPVREIRGDLLAIDADPSPFAAPGTRVLVINLRGSPNRATSAGTWEMATVSGIQGGFVKLTHPLERTYGQGGNTEDALADQSVRLIRIPQFRQLLVEGTLTGPAITDTTEGIAGGVLVFMASGRSDQGTGPSVISGNGTITMSGKGFRGADKPPDVAVRSTPDDANAPACSNPPSNFWHVHQVGAGANGYSGEGIENLRDTQTSVGGTSAGGGYNCGDGDVKPFKTGQPVVFANQTDQLIYGTSGSYATQGRDSCSFVGSGAVYGDAMLGHLFLGGGSGSVSVSQADDCYDQSHGCFRLGGNPANACCATAAAAYDGSGTSVTPVPTVDYPPPGDCDLSRVPGNCQSGSNSSCTTAPTLDGNCHAQMTGCNLGTGGCDPACAGASWVNYCDAKSTIWKSSAAGAPGGGIILASIAELQVKDSASIQSDGAWSGYCHVGADQSNQFASLANYCYGGAGGSVYLKSQTVDLGNANARLHAAGGTSGNLPGGGDGRIRLDYVTLANAAPTYANPTAVTVTLDGDTARSLPVLSLPDAPDPSVFTSAQAVVFPAGKPIPFHADGSLDVTKSNADSGLSLGLSADSGTGYGVLDQTGAVTFDPTNPPAQGKTARWRISPAPGQATGATRGFASKYTVGP